MKHEMHKEHEAHKKAKGGEVKGEKDHPNLYNAKGSPEEKEIEDEKDGFKKGGKKHAKGGHVHGHKAAHRLDKRARGGRMGDKSPWSSAKAGEMPVKQSSGKGSGHEDESPADFE